MTEPADVVTLAIPEQQPPLKMLLHGEEDRHVSATLRTRRIWEPFETELLLAALGPGDRVVDAGANIGYFSLLAASRVGETGRVYAFEPEPRNLDLLERNVALNGYGERIESVGAGLSDRAGDAQLHLSPDNLGDHQVHPDRRGRDTIRVPLVAGAEWMQGREQALDFLKVDVQGAEHQVILGLMPLLEASGARLRILLELTPRSLRAAGTSGRALIATLDELGLPFAIVDHVEHQLVPTDAGALATWCDNIDSYPEDAGFMNIFLGPAIYFRP